MMDTFRDRLLVCAECGSQFVFTVGEQRRMAAESGTVEDPAYCPVCAVKIQRHANDHASLPPVQGEPPIGEPLRQETVSSPPTREVPEIEVLPTWLTDEEEDEPAPAAATEPNAEQQEAVSPSSSRHQEPHPLHGKGGEQREGTVKWFNNRKGFGFITLDDGNELFVHYSGIVGEGYRSLGPGQVVTLVIEDTEKGPQASQVEVIED